MSMTVETDETDKTVETVETFGAAVDSRCEQ